MSVLRPGVKGLVVRDCLDRSAGFGLSIKLRRGIGITALVAAAFAVLTIQADARGGGHFGGGHFGGGRGGGMGMRGGAGFGGHSFGARSFSGPRMGVRSFSAPHIGARSFGAPRIGRSGVAVRSFEGNRFIGGSRAPSGVRPANARFAPGVGNRFVGARSFAGPGTLSRTAFRRGAVFGNRYITNPAWRTAIAPVRFYGRFLGSPWPWWTGGIVIGWIGPVFWPYVYDDFFNYVFWPYVYDDFWPYAYDDVYYGIYGAYAYYNPGQSKPRGRVQTGGTIRPPADVCNTPASDLTDWPIGRIAEIVQPTDLQRTELDALKDASAKAVAMLREACPNDLPSIPTGRLAAMENRLEVMLAAVKTIRPALDGFYQSLSDEQKERFNAVVPTDGNAATKDQQNFAKLCDTRSPGIMNLPIDRIAQAVNPTEPQRAALDELKTASLKAVDMLQTKCPTFRPLTPVGRVEAMEQRLDVTLGAAKTLQPALAKFYDMLSDEQKARFNALRSTGGEQG